MSATLVPITLDIDESEIAKEACRLMGEALDRSRATKIRLVVEKDGGSEGLPSLEVPPTILRVLSQVLVLMASRQTFSLHPDNEEVTTKQAADLLGVSRPYLISLLEKAEIPYRKVGRHRRILFSDVVKYGNTMKINRRSAINEMIQATEDAGAYDL